MMLGALKRGLRAPDRYGLPLRVDERLKVGRGSRSREFARRGRVYPDACLLGATDTAACARKIACDT